MILFGCQSLGEDLVELPLNPQTISSSSEIQLKKGEKVTIWTKCNVSFSKPNFKIKYLIEEKGKKIEFDSLIYDVNESYAIINSQASKEDVVEKNYYDKDTIIHKENFQFELKNKDFFAPKDGKYSFDFKLTSETESGSMFNHDYSIVLRK